MAVRPKKYTGPRGMRLRSAAAGAAAGAGAVAGGRPRRGVDRRGSARKRGYDWAWEQLARRRLAAEPFCRICARAGRVVPAACVDHIVPIAIAPERRLEWENTQALCVSCNTRKGKTERRRAE